MEVPHWAEPPNRIQTFFKEDYFFFLRVAFFLAAFLGAAFFLAGFFLAAFLGAAFFFTAFFLAGAFFLAAFFFTAFFLAGAFLAAFRLAFFFAAICSFHLLNLEHFRHSQKCLPKVEPMVKSITPIVEFTSWEGDLT